MTGGPNRWLALLSCSQRQVQLRHQSSVREGEGIVVIKLLGRVQVDATHQSTALDISLFTHLKWATSYVGVDIFCFVCSHLLQSLKRLIFGMEGVQRMHACRDFPFDTCMCWFDAPCQILTINLTNQIFMHVTKNYGAVWIVTMFVLCCHIIFPTLATLA